MKYLIGFLIVVIIALVGALAYFAGQNKFGSSQTATETQTSQTDETTPAVTATPTPAPKTKTVTGGGILSFPRYQLTVPVSWTYERESENADSEQIILAGDGFTMTISQGGFGGAMCLFPGDPEFEGPSGYYDYFEDIKTQSNDSLRRVWSSGTFTGYSLCQQTQYGWGSPTVYGHVSIKATVAPDSAQVTTLDSVIASFKKI
jgi:hypothetical protein